MSLFGALNSGVSGLSAQAAAMGVISDNISNSSTVGYKGTVSRFSTLVTAAATETSYTPGGVQMHPQALIDQQGLVQATTNSTAAAISGDGFFIVSGATNPDTSDERVFTRAGDFYADESGNLRNTAGFYLQGWATDRNGNLLDRSGSIIANTNNSSVSDLQTINIQQTALAAETQKVEIGANLNADQTLYNQPSLTSTGNAAYTTATSALVGHPGANLGDTLTVTIRNGANDTRTVTTTALTATTTMQDIVDEINTALSGTTSTVATATATATTDGNGNPVIQIVSDNTSYDLELTGNLATGMFADQNADDDDTAGTDAITSVTATGGPTYDVATNNGDMAAGSVTPHNTITVTVYDNLGSAHNIDVDLLSVSQNKWAFEMHTADADTATHTNGVIQTGYMTFNTDGTLADIQDSTGTSLIASGVTDAAVDIGPIDWAETDVGNPGTNTISFDFGEIGNNVGMTQYSGGVDENDNFKYDTYFINQDGASTGDFSSVSISDDGTVVASFANGLQRPIYKIAIGTFEAPNELEQSSGNVYRETQDSGSFLMRQAGEDGAGKIVSSSLEASNVDLATEFTTMIVTQRTYSANAKVITTSDDMLDELLRIKR